MHRVSRWSRTLVWLVVLVPAATACGGGAEPRPAVSPDAADDVGFAYEQSAELRDALAGGEVDYDDYLAGFQRYSACLSAAGHTVVMRPEEDERPLLKYAIPGAAVDSGADDECYHREFEPLDTAWQLANEDTSLWAETARECLRTRGIEPAASLAEMNVQLADAGIDHLECLGDA